jgi:hypothetical protein
MGPKNWPGSLEGGAGMAAVSPHKIVFAFREQFFMIVVCLRRQVS